MPESNQAERTTKAGYLAVSEIVNTATRLGAMILLARIFSKAEFSDYRQILLPYAFIMPLLALGLPDGLLYFLSIHRDRARNVLANNLAVLFGTSLLLFLFVLLGGNHLLAWGFNNPDLSAAYLIFAPFALLSLPTAPLRSCLVVMGRLKSLAGYLVVSRLVVFFAVVGAAWYFRSYEATVMALVISTGLFLPVAVWLMRRSCETGEWRMDMPEMCTQVGYSLPLGLSMIINQLSRNLDKVVVAAMCPKETFAAYVIGAMELPIINIVANSAASVITPDFAELYRDGKKAEMMALWRRTTVKCASIILPVMMFLLWAAEPAVIGVFTDRYTDSVIIFQIYLFLLPMRMFVFGPIFLATKQTRKIILRSAVAIVLNAFLTIMLTMQFGYIGAAIATVLTFVVWIFPYNIWFSCKYLQADLMEFFDVRKLVLILFCSVSGCMIFLLPSSMRPSQPILEVIELAILYFGSVGLMLHAFGLINLQKILVGVYQSLMKR